MGVAQNNTPWILTKHAARELYLIAKQTAAFRSLHAQNRHAVADAPPDVENCLTRSMAVGEIPFDNWHQPFRDWNSAW